MLRNLIRWSFYLYLALFIAWPQETHTFTPPAPQIVSVKPEPGASDVPLHAPGLLRVQFSQAMDRASVQNALQVTPGNVALRWAVLGSLVWENDATLSVMTESARFDEVAESLLAGVTYTVTMTTAARSANGIPLAQPFQWSFTTRSRSVRNEEVPARLVSAYQEKFGLCLPAPAVVETTERNSHLHYWTSTAYLDVGLFRLNLLEDGTVLSFVLPHRKPRGTYRVAVVAVDYGNTNIADVLRTLWVEAQQEINHQHRQWADALGYPEPILQFSNTNFLAPASQIANPRSINDIIAFVEANGYQRSDFDLFVSLIMDAQQPSGGLGYFGGNFVYVGYFFGATTFANLTSDMLSRLARGVYHHEMGHVFGWEHWWSPSYTGVFITEPVLFGWVDVDGDGRPEILDPSPYGLTRGDSASDVAQAPRARLKTED